MSISWYTDRRAQLYKRRNEYIASLSQCQSRYMDILQSIGLPPLIERYGKDATFQTNGWVSPCPRLFIKTHTPIGVQDSNLVTEHLLYAQEVEGVNDHNRNTLRILKSGDTYQPEYGLFWTGIAPYMPVQVLPHPVDQDGDLAFNEQPICGSWQHIADRVGTPGYPISPGDVVCAESVTALLRKPGASISYPPWVEGPQDAGHEQAFIRRITDAGVFVVLPAGNDYLWEPPDIERYRSFVPDDYGYQSSGALIATCNGEQLMYGGKPFGCRPSHSRTVTTPMRYPCGAQGWLRGQPVGTSWCAPLVAGTLVMIARIYQITKGTILQVPDLLRAVTSALTMQEASWKGGLHPVGRQWRPDRILEWLL